jgi:hypothetical protein
LGVLLWKKRSNKVVTTTHFAFNISPSISPSLVKTLIISHLNKHSSFLLTPMLGKVCPVPYNLAYALPLSYTQEA